MKRDLIGFGTFCLGRRIHIGIPFDLPYSISSHLVLILTPTHLVKILHLPAETLPIVNISDPRRPSPSLHAWLFHVRRAFACWRIFAPILHSTVMLVNSAVPSLLSPLCLFATVTQTHALATSRLQLEIAATSRLLPGTIPPNRHRRILASVRVAQHRPNARGISKHKDIPVRFSASRNHAA
jgi:hypothetical protein